MAKLWQWFFYISLFSLVGCVNYAGIHSSAHRYSTNDLSTPHRYPPPPNPKKNTNDWWTQFHDPVLNQLIDIGLQDSPTMAIAENRVQKATALTDIARTTLYPSVDFEGYANRERYSGTSIYGPYGNQYFYQGDAGLFAQYDFDFWKLHKNQVEAAVSRTKAAEADVDNAALVLSAQIASSYFLLQSHLTQLELATDLLNTAEEVNTITQKRLQHGVDSGIPLTGTEANVQIARIAMLYAKQTIDIEQHRLATLMGKNADNTTITVSPFSYTSAPFRLPTMLPLNLIAKRPDVREARWLVDAYLHDVKVSKATFFPDINLTAFYSYQSIGFNNLFKPASRNILIQPAMDLPLFDAGLHRAELRAIYADYDMAVNQYNQTILTAIKQTCDEITKIKTNQAQLSAQNTVVLQNARHYDLIRAQYKNGITDYVKTLNTKSLLLIQRLVQLQLQIQQIEYFIALIQDLGGNNAISVMDYPTEVKKP